MGESMRLIGESLAKTMDCFRQTPLHPHSLPFYNQYPDNSCSLNNREHLVIILTCNLSMQHFTMKDQTQTKHVRQLAIVIVIILLNIVLLKTSAEFYHEGINTN